MDEPGFTRPNVLQAVGVLLGAIGCGWNWWQEATPRQKDRLAERVGTGLGRASSGSRFSSCSPWL